ncbi:putative F-box domain-containing protein [Rosa chinensis]|uniref:Putative F-box domain-containing protein n=1 Tax=Rosa chinensis TaxID=74649 RepID=A0A2P6R7A0_ROSCH|nr:F-box/kelch-repeat protein At3g06240 [Rosa chinensis]PRQ42313.1 putative F-box domain-containing protein [Rosa chinensis]
MMQSSKLAEEIVVQFMSRLPPKALMRFKCIRKSWYNLINSPSFVAQNLSYSMNNKFTSSTCILSKHTVLKDGNITDRNEILDILTYGNNDKQQILLSLLNLCNDHNGDDQELFSVIKDNFIVPFPFDKCSLSLKIAGHCDGIICLVNVEDVALCNPSIKEFNHLPKSCLLLPPKNWDDYENEDDYYEALESESNAVGFGYDSKANVYKVVRIVQFTSGYVFTSHPSRVEVYTLGANCWREIKADVLVSTVCWSPSFEMYFKGIYYWDAYSYLTPRQYKDGILAFDMSDELFYLIYHPETTREFNKSLAVWKESIALITYEGDAPKCFDLWLNEDSSCFKGLWTKYFTIGPVEVEIPLVFWKSNEILMVNADKHIVSYNLDTQTLKCLPMHGVEDPEYIYAIIYVSSIISVNRDNKLECTTTSI